MLKLIGRNLSPYSRRVAVAMTLLDIPHSREYLSVTADPDRGLEVNPVGRVPVLELEDGERLIESAAILDYLMELVGPAKSLIPPHGRARRDCIQFMAIGSGVLDKSVNAIYEVRRRPAEKVHEPWRQHLLRQSAGGLAALDARAASRAGAWLLNDQIGMADITAAVAVTFLRVMVPELVTEGLYPALYALTERAEALPPFQAHPLEKP
ncbi:glutathione S-transferase family protein [Ferrovibrio sp.]|uniref:glutathione S-transferase family protein n=1 Tax=Ferrovibrio sp. TaxID=1917215 RepID=UPI000CB90B05|nr:glutathione S-transferase family protein [Ferrovibrio sp.]PJI41041.1 MAG: glutathione S-transferase [Ferrovibrio sp.]